MTDDEHSPNVRCTDCGNFVELIRRESGALALVCDCPTSVGIRGDDELPPGWADD